MPGNPLEIQQSPFLHRFASRSRRSLQSYYASRFFRYLVSLRKITQDATHSAYTWVPLQTWDEAWTDEALYAKYGATAGDRLYRAGGATHGAGRGGRR